MSNKEQFNLDEAIKLFYKTEPLMVDLSSAVSNKVFAEQRSSVSYKDIAAYLAIGFIGLVVLFLSLNYLVSLQLPLELLLLIIPVLFYFWLSAKEISALYIKYLQLK